MRLLLQNLGCFQMQMIGISQILRHMMLLGFSSFCLVCPLFHNFLQVSIVKSQRYDSVSFSGGVPKIQDSGGLIQLGTTQENDQNLGHSARKKYRSLYMNFYYANLMKSVKKRVKQIKVKGQENNFLALETSNMGFSQHKST